jgi:regulator of protease activity HflC (stomatin/prohibitin superfamily)
MASVEAVIVFYCVLFFLFILIISTLKRWIKVVRHSEVMIIERLGKYHKTLTPGCHMIIPYVDAPRRVHWRYLAVDPSDSQPKIQKVETDRVDLREHVIDFDRRHVITKDTVQISIDALVYYRITDPRAAVYAVQNLPDAIELLTQSTLRNCIATLTLDETFSSREAINAMLLGAIHRDSGRWGVTILRCEIVNILPPDDIKTAMERQIKEERDRRSTVIQADGVRESDVIRSRGAAAQLVLDAEAEKTSVTQRAKGEALAVSLQAEAEASCIKSIQGSMQGSGMAAADFSAAVEYLQLLRNITSLSPAGAALQNSGITASEVVMIPNESVDAIASILKA